MQTIVRRRRPPVASIRHAPAFEPPTAMGAFTKLNSGATLAAEWYLYTYLCGIGQLKGTNPFRTTIADLRSTWEFEGTEVHPIRLAINTLKGAMESLEALNLISVTRTGQGRLVLLDITIH